MPLPDPYYLSMKLGLNKASEIWLQAQHSTKRKNDVDPKWELRKIR